MRYLLHSANATYDSTTKKYTYTLDRRIQDPKSIRLVKASYVAATNSSYPAVVYLKSDGLSQLCSTKHTVELKNQCHEDGTNIFAVLEERHTAGKFSLEEAPRTLPVKKHENVTVIDIYFTDNDTVLTGEATASNGNGGSSSSVTDATIEAMPVVVWVDFDGARTLSASYAACTTLGDLVKYFYSRSPSPAGLIMQSNNVHELVLLKTGLLGISRDTDPALGHGQMLKDSTYPTSSWNDEFFVVHIFKSHPTYTQTAGIFSLGNNDVYVWMSGNGAVNFRNSSAQNVTLSNISWIPSRNYLLTIRRILNTSTSQHEFHWYWEDLDLGPSSGVTEVTDSGTAPTGGHYGFSYGIQGMYYRHVGGCLLGVNSNSTSDYDNGVQWARNWWGAEASEEEEESSASTPASFFLELDIKT
jgi:hypothetical protein